MINKLTIDNFLSIKHLDLELDSFKVMFGYNAAGKSNILRALKITARLAQGEKIDDIYQDINIWPETNYDESKISYELSLEGVKYFYSFTLKKSNKPGKIVEIVEENLMQAGDRNQLMTKENNTLTYHRDQKTIVSLSPEFADQYLALSIVEGISPQAGGIKDVLSNILVYLPDEDSLGNHKRVGLVEQKQKRNENLIETLFKLKEHKSQQYDRIVEELTNMIPRIKGIEIEKKANYLVGKLQEAEPSRAFAFASGSDGDIRTLLVLSRIFSQERPSLVAMDEIENSLHPNRIRQIVKLFSYIAERDISRTQVILTTHSAIVLEAVNEKDLIYVYRAQHTGETKTISFSKNEKILNEIRQMKQEDSLGNLFASGALENLFLEKYTSEITRNS